VENDGRLDHAQQMAGRELPRTTNLCDLTRDKSGICQIRATPPSGGACF
jgi:hypothetical protein